MATEVVDKLAKPYTDITACVVGEDSLSNSFDLNKGVKQGYPASLTVFLPYIN